MNCFNGYQKIATVIQFHKKAIKWANHEITIEFMRIPIKAFFKMLFSLRVPITARKRRLFLLTGIRLSALISVAHKS